MKKEITLEDKKNLIECKQYFDDFNNKSLFFAHFYSKSEKVLFWATAISAVVSLIFKPLVYIPVVCLVAYLGAPICKVLENRMQAKVITGCRFNYSQFKKLLKSGKIREWEKELKEIKVEEYSSNKSETTANIKSSTAFVSANLSKTTKAKPQEGLEK